MMRNFKLTLEYDGTDFHGWQRQPGLRTVQGTIEEALENIVGRNVPVDGAGRTDAGVHAFGQVASVKTEARLGAEELHRALSANIPEDINIYHLEEADAKFHARFSATSRRYVYYLRTETTAIWRRFAHVVTYPLDIGRMQSAAAALLGEQDFTSFTPKQSLDAPPVCNVLNADVEDVDEVISVTLVADRFLHNMVRVIVGTLVEVGRGKIPVEQIKDIVGKKDRTAAGPTTPPNGLFLMEVRYDD